MKNRNAIVITLIIGVGIALAAQTARTPAPAQKPLVDLLPPVAPSVFEAYPNERPKDVVLFLHTQNLLRSRDTMARAIQDLAKQVKAQNDRLAKLEPVVDPNQEAGNK